jgi:uncharacterized membrane protein YhaH (DUF805 family)
MNAKFWAINGIAFTIILVYVACWVFFAMHGMDTEPFWKASPMGLVFMGSFFYLLTEGKLVQKIILAKRLKDEGTASEFAIIDKSANKLDDNILDRFKKN